MGLHSYSPGQLALLRFLIASVFMAGVALVLGIGRPRLRDMPWLLVLSFFGVFLHHTSLNYGQQFVTAAASSVLAQSAPLFSVLIAFFCLKERVSLWRWSCVLLGLLGVLVVIWGDHGVGDIDPRGLLILLAAVSWSLYFAIQKHYAHRYSPLTMACYMVCAGLMHRGLSQVCLTTSGHSPVASKCTRRCCWRDCPCLHWGVGACSGLRAACCS